MRQKQRSGSFQWKKIIQGILQKMCHINFDEQNFVKFIIKNCNNLYVGAKFLIEF